MATLATNPVPQPTGPCRRGANFRVGVHESSTRNRFLTRELASLTPGCTRTRALLHSSGCWLRRLSGAERFRDMQRTARTSNGAMIGPMTEGVSAIDAVKDHQRIRRSSQRRTLRAGQRSNHAGRSHLSTRPRRAEAITVEEARRYRTRGHNVYVGENGAIAFENVKTKLIEFSKPGSDGKEIEK
jgi:hypothetical protein